MNCYHVKHPSSSSSPLDWIRGIQAIVTGVMNVEEAE